LWRVMACVLAQWTWHPTAKAPSNRPIGSKFWRLAENKKMTRFSVHRTLRRTTCAKARCRPHVAVHTPCQERLQNSMDLTRLEISRRTALLTSAAIAANVVNPMRAFAQEAPRKGGVFNVHYGAEQRQLNPSLQASTGVYIIGGKIQENLVDLDAYGNPSTSADVEFTPLNMWKKILNYGSTLHLYPTAVDTPDAQTAIFCYDR